MIRSLFLFSIVAATGCSLEMAKSDDSAAPDEAVTDADDAGGTVLDDTGAADGDDPPSDDSGTSADDADGSTSDDTGSSDVDEGTEDDTAADDDSASPVVAEDLDEDGFSEEDGDCDDSDGSVHPGIAEVCDGIDNDCDGLIDEDVLLTLYVDYDGDGFGSDSLTMEACAPEDMWVVDGSDCDDLSDRVYPDAPEMCDGLDNDCDAIIDEDVLSTYYMDSDGDGHGDPLVLIDDCLPPEGAVALGDDCDDADPMVAPGADEICDGVDNDCDLEVDEGAMTTFYIDYDADGYGGSAYTVEACAMPDGYALDDSDCMDADPAIHPGSPELCDGIDNDCDGEFDEGAESTFYADADEDGFGDPSVTSVGCEPADGFILVAGDCADDDPMSYPDAAELCDEVDNDCDTEIDEGVKSTFYIDYDEDGFGSPTYTTEACVPPAGYVSDVSDCDDSDSAISPDAVEVCDEVDNDCDGETDEEVGLIFYSDLDGDGYGSEPASFLACTPPTGFVVDSTDCNDADPSISPGETEVCDEVDNNCDGAIDEGAGTVFYSDLDGDGFGNPDASVVACEPGLWMVADGSDCDDSSPAIRPGAEEVCDYMDNNCDGEVDEGVTSTYYLDFDGDGFGSATDPIEDCGPGDDFVADMTDCDDDDMTIYPGAPEECDDIDSDCDGVGSPPSCFSSCGDGVLDTDEYEEMDPPSSPYASVEIDDATCRWDFSDVQQLYCNGGCSWAGVSDCDIADANIFCKLKTGNPDSTALSFSTTTALPEPGFPCIWSGDVIYVDRGVDREVRYQDWSILGDHGPGTVIVDPVCTDP